MTTALIPAAAVDVTETSWTPSTDMTFEEWSQAGDSLQRIGRAWQWWLGDWMLFGECCYGDTYTQAISTTGLEVQTLMDIAWVARSVGISVRDENLSWSHHRVVASLEPAEQAVWLTRAADEGMTVARLRSRLQSAPAERDESPARPATHAVSLTVTIGASSDEDAQAQAVALQALLERRGATVTRHRVKAL